MCVCVCINNYYKLYKLIFMQRSLSLNLVLMVFSFLVQFLQFYTIYDLFYCH